MAKYSKVAEMVAQQLERGDYRLRRFPSINQLAKEMSINPRTISKAVDELVRQGMLKRDDTGRVAVSTRFQNKIVHIALLHPAFASPAYTLAQQQLRRLTDARGWQLKPVVYTHWYDPVINQSLNGFDGIFFMPPSEDIPGDIIKLMAASPNRLVVTDQDISEHSVPSLQFTTPAAVSKLLNALLEGGHRNVICLSTQPNDPVIRERIEQWRLWCRMNKVDGRLIDRHVEPHGPSALESAYHTTCELVDAGELKDTAVFCTTGAAGVGVMRALIDRGLKPGHDIAVCAADDDAGRARYISPTLTCVRDPDWSAYLSVCLDWFEGGDWIGPLLIQPHEVRLFHGESTGATSPAPSN